MVVVVPSPQAIVPEKSMVGAFLLASMKLALRLVAVVYSMPPLALTVPAVKAASATLNVLVLWLVVAL
jgi:hypothetical protein